MIPAPTPARPSPPVAGRRRAKARSLLAGLVVAIGITLTGCSGETHDAIYIAVNPWPGYEFLHLADQEGYFAQEGVDVDLVEFSSLADSARAYERGDVDAIASTLVEVLDAREHTEDKPQVVLALDYSDGADVIVARKGIRSVRDLKGAKVAVEVGTVGPYLVARALASAGLSLDDVKLIPTSQLDVADLMMRGEIDAAASYPPVSVEVLRQSGTRTVFTSSAIPGEVVDVLSVREDIVEGRRDDVDGLRRAWDRAVAHARARPEVSIAAMAQREGISPDEFADALRRVRVLDLTEQRDHFSSGRLALLCDRTARVMVSIGALRSPAASDGCVVPAPLPDGGRLTGSSR